MALEHSETKPLHLGWAAAVLLTALFMNNVDTAVTHVAAPSIGASIA